MQQGKADQHQDEEPVTLGEVLVRIKATWRWRWAVTKAYWPWQLALLGLSGYGVFGGPYSAFFLGIYFFVIVILKLCGFFELPPRPPHEEK